MNTAETWFAKALGNRNIGLVIALCAILVGFTAAVGPTPFLTTANLTTVALAVAIVALVAVGQTAVLLTRNIDLSVGSIVALAAYFTIELTHAVPGLPLGLAAVASLAAGAALGAVNGFFVAIAGLPSIIVTLGTLSIFRGVQFLLSGGHRALAGDAVAHFGAGSLLGVPNVAWCALAVAVLVGWLLGWTRVGRDLYAVGNDPAAARIVGIPIKRRVFTALVLSGALAGLGGFMYASLYVTVDQGSAVGFEFAVITAAVIGGVSVFGGVGNPFGAVLGALILGFINDGLVLLKLAPAYQTAFQGTALVAVVTVDAFIVRAVERRERAATRRRRGHTDTDGPLAPVTAPFAVARGG